MKKESIVIAESPVSGLLEERLAPEAQRGVFLRWIRRSFAASFPFLHQINRAHLLELSRLGLNSDEVNRALSRDHDRAAGAGFLLHDDLRVRHVGLA
mgnify:CR=1 FL=1